MPEIWKDIHGYETFYQVSDLGNVRSLDREFTRLNRWGKKTIYQYKGRQLKNIPNGTGYHVVGLSKIGKLETTLVHRLVFEAFNGPILEGLVITHVDGNNTNNIPSNLKAGTQQDNLDDRKMSGTLNNPSGEKHYSAKLTEKDVQYIRDMLLKGEKTQKELSEIFKVNQSTISSIKSRKTWTHI